MIAKIPVDLPERIEAQRLYLRPYRAGDGAWYYAMSLRNREHLLPYEAGNPALSLESEEAAEALMREFATDWTQGNAFFLGAFRREDDVFLAQIYVGPVSWELPEFVVGYFVDVAHEGHGYVSEAVRAALGSFAIWGPGASACAATSATRAASVWPSAAGCCAKDICARTSATPTAA
jgi:RimJ/RimL family protein N-acetyltransferase